MQPHRRPDRLVTAAVVLLATGAALPPLLRAAAPTREAPLAAAGLLLLVTAGIARASLDRAGWDALPSRGWRDDLARFALLVVALGTVAAIHRGAAWPDALRPAGTLLVVAVVPAASEELVYRGLIGEVVRARWGTAWATILSSLAFALAHPAATDGAVLSGYAAHCLAGAALFLLRPAGSLLTPLLAHAANNAAVHLAWNR